MYDTKSYFHIAYMHIDLALDQHGVIRIEELAIYGIPT